MKILLASLLVVASFGAVWSGNAPLQEGAVRMQTWRELIVRADWKEESEPRLWSAIYSVPIITKEAVTEGTVTVYLCGRASDEHDYCVPAISSGLGIKAVAFYEYGALRLMLSGNRNDVVNLVGNFHVLRVVVLTPS